MKSSITFTFSSYSFVALLLLGACSATAGTGISAPNTSVKPQASANCTVLPAIDPKKDFVGNFNNPCYAVKMGQGNGHSNVGDLNATYNQMYYQIQPGYSFIILGTFPNSRFMSATAYDDHLLIVGQLIDNQILPLTSSMVNPLLPGATFVPNQQYGITVNLGAGAPVSITPGCATSPTTTIDQNVMDASMIHLGQNWDGLPNLPAGFPLHENGPNKAGVLEVRKYVDISTPSDAVVIVRQMSDGCALSAAQAIANNILAPSQPNPSPWLHEGQMQHHQIVTEQLTPRMCFPPDPTNKVQWRRLKQYIPIENGANASITTTVNTAYVQAMVAGTNFMRVQFKLPTHPTTPCLNGACSLTGAEQQRYKSLSFQNGSETLLSLKDTDFVTDPNGNVTLIVSLGAVPPPQVTAANYYTYADLTKNPNYALLQTLMVRDILPNANFLCSSFNVPYKTMTFNDVGGYLGQYEMTVDFPGAAAIPTIPVPPVRSDTCAMVPMPPATVCPGSTPTPAP